MSYATRAPLFAVLFLFALTSCDFGAAEDAIDDFEVVVGLPSLATVVNVQALDASSGDPISRDVQVTFEGTDASAVVDIYSDPLSQLTVQEGFANFALDSTRSPSPDNPAQLTLRAQAQGYNATSVSVRVTQEGSVGRVIRLTPENPEQSASGTSGSRTTVGATDSGETTQSVRTQTGQTSSGPDAAQGSVSIPSGTRLETASGEPLQDQVTTDLAVYDNSADAQGLLPVEAKQTENGRRQIRGAVRFQARDSGGRLASRFSASGPDTTVVTADLPVLSAGNGTPTVTLVNPNTGASQTVALSTTTASRAKRAAAGARAPTTFRFVGNQVIVNSPSGTTTIDASNLGGAFFAAVGVDPSQGCTPQGTLSINPNGQSGTVAVRVAGEGVAVDAEVRIPDPQSTFQLSASTLFDGEIPDIGSATLTVRTPDEQEVSTNLGLCSGSGSVTLPTPTNNRIGATVRVVPNCPAGERLPVSPPFDGYSVAYRPANSNGAYRTVPKEDITINTTNDDLETVTSAVVPVSGVLPNTEYEFVGTFGDESSTQSVTMPGQDGGEVTVTDQELSDQCR